ncbi:MAG: sigma-70 family RNA polymerase sigma factor [Rhodospirillaceae bacterium]|nr:MAG: sigma-70 family RNA polymerase sigma factor [Rhodospirillaceae bacterium]
MPPTDESDAVLAARAKAGDRPAFDQLILRHKALLYRFVRRYTGNNDDAYDILQDSFIAAWLALRRYDPSRDFATWLRTIALNKCRDFGRRGAVRRRILRLFAFEHAGGKHMHAHVTPDAESPDEQRQRRLDAAIAALPAFYKEPLLLTIVAGLSQQDVATQLKTTTKAIEMRLRRAKKSLVVALADSDGEG